MEGLVKKIKGIRNEMIGLSIVLMLAGIFMILFPNTSGNIICRGVGCGSLYLGCGSSGCVF